MRSDSRLTVSDEKAVRQKTLYVQASYTALYKVADEQTSQLTELIHGQAFHVHENSKDWAFGQVVPLIAGSVRPGYVGWLKRIDLAERNIPPTHFVTALSAPVFTKADLKSPISQSLSLGSRIIVSESFGKYLCIGPDRWMHRQHVAPIEEALKDFVDVARLYLGQPYVWGGNGVRGVDCSGLVQMSLAACGIDAPRDADLQEQSLGKAVADTAMENLRRGDLLFWKGHVGIISAPNRLLHANATHMSVVEEPLDVALKRMAGDQLPLRCVKRL